MTFKYSICYPGKEEIEYFNTPISGKEVLEITKNYPWLEKSNFSDSLKPEELY